MDVNTLAVDEFAASYGLPITPSIPILKQGGSNNSVVDSTGSDSIRESVRQVKNVNRSLDKLRKQIKEAKEERRRLKMMGGNVPPQDEIESLIDKKSNKRKTVEGKVNNSNNNDKHSVREKEEEEEEDTFLVPKKQKQAHESISGEAPASSKPETVNAHVFSTIQSSNKPNALGLSTAAASMKIKKQKPLKITSDGLSKDTIRAGTYSKKIVFNEDTHEAPEPVQLQIQNNSTVNMNKTDLNKATLHYQSMKRRQLSEAQEEDTARDRERIHSKHREKRIASKQSRKTEEEEEGTGATLAYSGDRSDDDEE